MSKYLRLQQMYETGATFETAIQKSKPQNIAQQTRKRSAAVRRFLFHYVCKLHTQRKHIDIIKRHDKKRGQRVCREANSILKGVQTRTRIVAHLGSNNTKKKSYPYLT
jgi:hypothetical protein